jgi:hypothetical protein
VLYRLLYDALIEIRGDGQAMTTPRVFQLADLFHTIPLQLERMERGEVSPEEVLHGLQARARATGMDGWVEHRTAEDAKWAGDESPEAETLVDQGK